MAIPTEPVGSLPRPVKLQAAYPWLPGNSLATLNL
jgi:hypothetical protein